MKKLAWILSTAVSLAATSACAPVEDTAVEEEVVGSASLAISAIGPDGHRYRLFNGTSFQVSTGGNLAFTVPLSESLERQTVDFEVGSYTAELVGPGSGSGSILLLRDNPDGSSLTVVTAQQVSPNPLPFVIRPGQTTQLTFRFAVPELGDVVFSAGSVDVGIDVESQSEPSQGSMFHASGNLTVSDAFTDVAAVPGLQVLADGAAVGSAAYANIGLDRTGDWRFSPDGFCADVHFGSTGSNQPAVNALLVQALGATGELCFNRESVGGLMLFTLSRTGTPYVFEPEFGLPDPFSIRIEGFGTPSESLVDGGVLRLSRLDEPLEVGSAGYTISVEAGGITVASVTFTGSLSLTANP